jgi:putative ABC transport system permease protein
MGDVIHLSWWDVALSAGLVIALAILSWVQRLALERQIIIAASRTILQLILVGLALKFVFSEERVWLILVMALVMISVASWEIAARQKRRIKGLWTYGIGSLSMFISSFTVTLFALIVIIGNTPWYEAQYAIPLLGMMLGNTMTGIALSLDRLTTELWQQRAIIEGRLILGEPWWQAVGDIRRDAVRSGLIPVINAMAAVGVVSLPGMMTGQILAGVAPIEAVKYQILIMFMISAGAGFGTVIALKIATKRLFDERERLRLDRLS